MEKMEMVKFYEQKSVAVGYILGFEHLKQIFMVITDHINPDLLTVEQASRNQGDNLRLRIRKAHKAELLTKAICLGSVEQLTQEKYNKGEIFEKIITERAGQEWFKDNVPFYEGADLTVDGVAYSIKFQKATICTESTLDRIGA